MFTSSPRFLTLAEQVARTLENDIRRGALGGSLPGERQLVETLQVSRRTIRAATEILRQKKLIRTAHGLNSMITSRSRSMSDRSPTRTIGMLLPMPLDEIKPFANLVDKLRTLLSANGYRLETHFEERYLSRRPAAALELLVARFSYDGWILASANRACQAWFCSQGIATVLHGPAHDGVTLPCVDIDMLAASRHAANVLLRKGHRHLALVIAETDWAGHLKTEQGFLAAVRESGGEAVGHVLRHRGDVTGLKQAIARALQSAAPPTALFIVNPHHYIAVAAILAAKGLVVPRDISLLCRDDDICLRYLPIEPSRYVYSSQTMAKEIFAVLMRIMRAGPGHRPMKSVLMLPKFVEGASLAERG